jgi:hypothetical protein
MRRSLPQLYFTVLVLGVLLLRDAQLQPVAGIEEDFINWLAANGTGAQHESAPVTLIEINDTCMLNYAWPWSPLNYALFLNAATEFQARAAAIEPVLSWEDQALSPEQLIQQPQFEKILHDAILRTPKLELGAELGFPEDPDVLPAMQPLPVLRDVTGETDSVPEYTVIQAEPGEDIRLTAALGFCNVPAVEPAARHAPLVFRYRGNIVTSFVLRALMLWNGVQPEDVQVRLGSEIRLGDKLSIPINQAGAMRVDWQQPVDRVGFDDLVLAEDQLEGKHAPVVDPAILKDRLLVLARTDSKSQTIQLGTGRMGSSGELFAAALATAEGKSFARPSGYCGAILVLLLGLVLAHALAVRRKLLIFPVMLGFCAAYLLGCLAVFETTRIALPLTPMLGLTIFLGILRWVAPAEKTPQ